MSITSFKFVVFFLIVIVCYFLVPKKFKNIVLLVGSTAFYMFAVPKYIILMLFSTIVTYFAARLLESQSTLKRRRFVMALNILANLGILGVFKYYNFFGGIVTSVLALAGLTVTLPALTLIQPLGISFYTFQVIGYCIDVYRGKIKAEKNFIVYSLFVSFFPQIGAGPIGRAGDLIPQFRERHTFNVSDVTSGLRLVLLGAFKKIAIADTLAIFVNYVFNNLQINQYKGATLAITMILYSVQIYCDFSGYSDMATGCARILGFRLMENFNAPYLSASVTQFWGRWHISLSSWFKDYLYFPLGGNRKGFFRKCLNILIIFLVSGIWHGASLHFVAWGLLHGIYRIFEEGCKKVWAGKIEFTVPLLNKGKTLVQTLLTFMAVGYAWIFFRAPGMTDALYTASSIFKSEKLSVAVENYKKIAEAAIGGSYSLAVAIEVSILIFLVFIMLVDLKDRHAVSSKYLHRETILFSIKNPILRYFVYYVMGMSIVIWYLIQNTAGGQISQFIYFNF